MKLTQILSVENRLVVTVILGCLTIALYAQDLSDVLFPDSSITYYGQVSSNGKERNGMGILNLKKEGIYCGDFSRNKFHGTGILISPCDKTIPKCENAKFFVGRWFRGKKEGRGRLYDAYGNLIYDGKFSDDVPSSLEFSNKNDSVRFSIMEIDNELFIGETINGIPNGYGLFQDDEGFITFCQVQNGMKNSVGIMILPPANWGVYNIINELYFPITTSKEQNSRAAAYKVNRQRERAQLLQVFSNILNEGIDLLNDITSLIYEDPPLEGQSNGGSENKSNSSSIHSNSSESKGGQKYNIGEQQNFNNDKATYSKYESILSAVFTGNREASASEIKEWQKKMKMIRKKWTDKGKTFPHSELEDR